MFNQIDYVMVVVSDMNQSVEFYRDKLGFKLGYETPEWTEFDTGKTKFALHGGGRKPEGSSSGMQHSGESANRPPAGTASIGFDVEDIQKTYEELKARGLYFIMPPMVREGEPIKLAICLDPDGLRVVLSEHIR